MRKLKIIAGALALSSIGGGLYYIKDREIKNFADLKRWIRRDLGQFTPEAKENRAKNEAAKVANQKYGVSTKDFRMMTSNDMMLGF